MTNDKSVTLEAEIMSVANHNPISVILAATVVGVAQFLIALDDSNITDADKVRGRLSVAQSLRNFSNSIVEEAKASPAYQDVIDSLSKKVIVT